MTIDLLGNYWMIMEGDKLVAMLGAEVVSSEDAYKILDLVNGYSSREEVRQGRVEPPDWK